MGDESDSSPVIVEVGPPYDCQHVQQDCMQPYEEGGGELEDKSGIVAGCGSGAGESDGLPTRKQRNRVVECFENAADSDSKNSEAPPPGSQNKCEFRQSSVPNDGEGFGTNLQGLVVDLLDDLPLNDNYYDKKSVILANKGDAVQHQVDVSAKQEQSTDCQEHKNRCDDNNDKARRHAYYSGNRDHTDTAQEIPKTVEAHYEQGEDFAVPRLRRSRCSIENIGKLSANGKMDASEGNNALQSSEPYPHPSTEQLKVYGRDGAAAAAKKDQTHKSQGRSKLVAVSDRQGQRRHEYHTVDLLTDDLSNLRQRQMSKSSDPKFPSTGRTGALKEGMDTRSKSSHSSRRPKKIGYATEVFSNGKFVEKTNARSLNETSIFPVLANTCFGPENPSFSTPAAAETETSSPSITEFISQGDGQVHHHRQHSAERQSHRRDILQPAFQSEAQFHIKHQHSEVSNRELMMCKVLPNLRDLAVSSGVKGMKTGVLFRSARNFSANIDFLQEVMCKHLGVVTVIDLREDDLTQAPREEFFARAIMQLLYRPSKISKHSMTVPPLYACRTYGDDSQQQPHNDISSKTKNLTERSRQADTQCEASRSFGGRRVVQTYKRPSVTTVDDTYQLRTKGPQYASLPSRENVIDGRPEGEFDDGTQRIGEVGGAADAQALGRHFAEEDDRQMNVRSPLIDQKVQEMTTSRLHSDEVPHHTRHVHISSAGGRGGEKGQVQHLSGGNEMLRSVVVERKNQMANWDVRAVGDWGVVDRGRSNSQQLSHKHSHTTRRRMYICNILGTEACRKRIVNVVKDSGYFPLFTVFKVTDKVLGSTFAPYYFCKYFVNMHGVAKSYVEMLQYCGERICEALKIITMAQGPILFHCSIGKDRTGLIAALILRIMGATDEAIALDYSLTELSCNPMFEHYVKRFIEKDSGLSEEFCRAQPAYILDALEFLNNEYGGASRYFDSIGFTDDWRHSLRCRYFDFHAHR